jgi:hypothetical protein
MSQRGDIDGDHNNTVQIVGDNNTVTIKGARALTLTRYANRGKVRREFDLLKPYTESIPIIGRETERAALLDWLKPKAESVSVRVLTGAGGSGKTRLAIDLIERAGEGFPAGFLKGDDLKPLVESGATLDWRWTVPTLVAVDYAAAHAEPLRRWLRQIAEHVRDDSPPLRVLLLEREAATASGWWHTVFGGGLADDDLVRDLLDPAAPVRLEPLAADEARREVFAAMLARAEGEVTMPAHGEHPAFDGRLAEITWGGRPLFLMMAALLAAKEGIAGLLDLRRGDLAFRLAEGELSRVGRVAESRGLDADVAVAMTGLVTLAQGLAWKALLAAIPPEQADLGRSSSDPGRIADLLVELFPGDERGAAPILPDMIGEAAILLAFRHHPDSAAAVVRSFAVRSELTTASVIRCAEDFLGESFEDGEAANQPLLWLDALIDRGIDLDQLQMISRHLIDALRPSGTSLAVVGHAGRVLEAIIRHVEAQFAASGDTSLRETLAHHKHDLGPILSALGRREEALSAAEEAVALYRSWRRPRLRPFARISPCRSTISRQT